jgi:hypothetical protein
MALPSGSSPTSSPRVALVRQGRQVVAAVAQAGGSDVVLGLFGAFQRIFGGAWLGARRVGALNNPDNQTRHPGRANRPLRGPKSPTAVPSGKWSGLTRTRCVAFEVLCRSSEGLPTPVLEMSRCCCCSWIHLSIFLWCTFFTSVSSRSASSGSDDKEVVDTIHSHPGPERRPRGTQGHCPCMRS